MTAKKLASLVMLLLFCVVTTPTVSSQTNDRSKAKDNKATSERHRDDRDSNEPPRDGEEWFARGYRLHGADRHHEAIEAFKHAIDFAYRKGTAMYNIACGYALINDKENALIWLQRAIDNGFNDRDHFASDSDLDPIRTDARYKKIISSLPLGDLYVRKEKGYGKRDRLEQANYDYDRLEREASKDGDDWARVGARMLMLRDFDRALPALHKAVELLGDQGDTAMYNLACAYSLKGDREAGINWLDKSVNAGFDSPDKLRYDPDLNNVRSHSRFARIQQLANTLSLSQFNKDEDGNFNHSDNSNYSKARWAPAIQLYESFVKTEPNLGRAWFNLGYALHYSSEHAKAIDAFQRALNLGYHKHTTMYNIACGYSMLNERDKAFEWLERATSAGFNSFGDFSWDSDLANLRSDPRFRKFLEAAKVNAKVKHKTEME